MLGCGRIDFSPYADGAGALGDGGAVNATGDAADALVTSTSVCPSTVLINDDFEDGVTAPEWSLLTGTATVPTNAVRAEVHLGYNSGRATI